MKYLALFLYIPLSILWQPAKFHRTTENSLKGCNYQTFGLGKSHKGKDIIGYEIPGKSADKIVLTGGIHGNEKGAPVFVANVLANICRLDNKQPYTVVGFPLLNPDGFMRKPGGRKNGRWVDLNRDAFNRTENESKLLHGWAKKNRGKILRHFAVHMTGNIMILPRPWTRAYEDSKKLAKRMKALGLNWHIRDSQVYGTWNSYFSELGIPSVLLELGRSRDGINYPPWKQVKFLRKPLKVVLKALHQKWKRAANLRNGIAKKRIQKFELKKCRNKKKRQRILKRLKKHMRRSIGPTWKC